jgi:peptidyl-dipeptidase Dcp
LLKITTMNTTNNPILIESKYPHNAIDFDAIKPDHFIPALKVAIDKAHEKILKIKNEKTPDFTNTVFALEECTEDTSFVYHLFYNLLNANGDDELHKISEEIMPMMAKFSSDLSLDIELFNKVKVVYESKNQLKLNTEQNRLLLDTYQSFTRNGSLLNEADRDQLRKIDEELANLAPQFSKNVTQATNSYKLIIRDSMDLSGLPKSVVAAAKHLAEEQGLKDAWAFTLQMPSYIPFVKYCDNRKLREEMVTSYAKMNNSGEFDNKPLIFKILKLREKRAQLLGYKNHADYTLEKRMAETTERVSHFLNDLFEVARPACEKEIKDLQAFVDKIGGPNQLQSWDFDYYSEKYKKELFHFDEQELKPYFKLENVVKGVFAVTGKLFELDFQHSDSYPTYHPEVEVVEVHKKTGEYVGLLYLDYFPHSHKKSGAWMTSFREQGFYRSKVHRPHISIVCNFTKSTPGHPSLLSLSEVETLFHEFGHALHGLLSNCEYRSHSGTSVYWDFVELPSQIMENWVKESESLKIFAKHFETENVIPDELIKKIKAVSQFQTGYANLRQLRFAMLDMAYHTTPTKEITDIELFEEKVTSKHRVFPKIAGTCTSVGFQHIFAGGYSSGYYSYKWAEVLDADAFDYFLETGIFNPKTAKSFRENILEKGGTEHPMVLYKNFRGHEPDSKALLKRDGLI